MKKVITVCDACKKEFTPQPNSYKVWVKIEQHYPTVPQIVINEQDKDYCCTECLLSSRDTGNKIIKNNVQEV